MSRRGLRTGALALVLAGTCGLSACADSAGPLEGPREGIKVTTQCSPTGPEGSVFGIVLRARGQDPVTITSTSFEGSNLHEPRALIDHEGVGRDELVGAWSWPLTGELAFGPALMERAVDAVDAVVEPGSEVSVLLVVEPEDDARPAELRRVDIGYEAGGRSWTERNETVLTAAPDGCGGDGR